MTTTMIATIHPHTQKYRQDHCTEQAHDVVNGPVRSRLARHKGAARFGICNNRTTLISSMQAGIRLQGSPGSAQRSSRARRRKGQPGEWAHGFGFVDADCTQCEREVDRHHLSVEEETR
jgi:hypothetical protein